MVLRFIRDRQRLYKAIQIAFANDDDLMCRVHAMSGGFDACVDDTFNTILDASTDTILEWYEVVHDGEVIGFTILSKLYRYLFSFGIAKEMRTRDVIGLWWTQITCLLRGGFSCCLWAKNRTAVSFLMERGMHVVNDAELETQLIYN